MQAIPHDPDAERSLIGSMLLHQDVIDDVALETSESDFLDTATAAIYATLLRLHNEGKRVDARLLAHSLGSSYAKVGGFKMIESCIKSVPNAAHAVYYAKIVREKATLRSLVDLSNSTLQDASKGDTEARELLERVQSGVSRLEDSQATCEPVTARRLLSDALDELERRKERDGQHGVMTGFPDLDEMLGGLRPGQLVIVAGRPSMGKSALAANIATHAAFQQEVSTLFVSLEMSGIDLADRLMASRSRVNLSRMRTGAIDQSERAKLVESASELSQAPLSILDDPMITASAIGAQARRVKRKHGLGLLVIDYLQLISPDNDRDSREQQVSKISRRLKQLAKTLDVPVICAAQLSRKTDDSGNNKPRLSHLRESGAIEQDADVVMFVHRDEYYRPDDSDAKGKAQVIVAKQRNGPTGDVNLLWRSSYTLFETPSAFDDADEPVDLSRVTAFDEWND